MICFTYTDVYLRPIRSAIVKQGSIEPHFSSRGWQGFLERTLIVLPSDGVGIIPESVPLGRARCMSFLTVCGILTVFVEGRVEGIHQ